jgi:hypothetical protein
MKIKAATALAAWAVGTAWLILFVILEHFDADGPAVLEPHERLALDEAEPRRARDDGVADAVHGCGLGKKGHERSSDQRHGDHRGQRGGETGQRTGTRLDDGLQSQSLLKPTREIRTPIVKTARNSSVLSGKPSVKKTGPGL